MKCIMLAASVLIATACSAPTAPAQKTVATVTDPSVPVADSEAAALAGVGGEHLVKGCTVQILKVTDRALRINALKCPDVPWMEPLNKWLNGTEGWIAKSATDF